HVTRAQLVVRRIRSGKRILGWQGKGAGLPVVDTTHLPRDENSTCAHRVARDSYRPSAGHRDQEARTHAGLASLASSKSSLVALSATLAGSAAGSGTEARVKSSRLATAVDSRHSRNCSRASSRYPSSSISTIRVHASTAPATSCRGARSDFSGKSRSGDSNARAHPATEPSGA